MARMCACGCGHTIVVGRRYAPGHRNLHPRGLHAASERRRLAGIAYRRVPGHPHADADGFVAEHRLIVETIIGRPLRPGEKVFHRNGDKGDNRPENLRLQFNPRHRST